MKGAWKTCRNILAVRLDNMGDVLMTEPALRALRGSFPKARLSLLTSRVGEEIARLFPELDEVFALEAPWVAREKYADLEEFEYAAATLRRKKFDAAVIFTNFSQSALPAALFTYLCRIPRTLAYAREHPYGLLSDRVADTEPFTHVMHGVQRQLDLVGAVGAHTKEQRIRIDIPNDARRAVLRLLRGSGIEGEFLVLHPGVSDDKRRYPRQKFVAAAREVAMRTGLGVVVTGSRNELALARSVVHGIGNAARSAGSLSVPQLCALIERASLLISNNTGPVHIASAVGTPVVDLYARTNPEHVPWNIPSRVLYFDVPRKRRTKNPLLAALLPAGKHPMPKPADIALAAEELIAKVHASDSGIPLALRTWDPENLPS